VTVQRRLQRFHLLDPRSQPGVSYSQDTTSPYCTVTVATSIDAPGDKTGRTLLYVRQFTVRCLYDVHQSHPSKTMHQGGPTDNIIVRESYTNCRTQSSSETGMGRDQGRAHSSRKRGTVPRPLTRNHRPESRYGNEVRYDTIQRAERVPR
jgi:hypothetical protein